MEEIDLFELIKKWCKVLYKNKWWILGITTLAAVLSFVFTLPGINKPLKEVNSAFWIINFPKTAGIDQQNFAKKYFLSSEFKYKILEIYGEDIDSNTEFCMQNFDKRVIISTSRTEILFKVRHESVEKAIQIINTAVDLLSDKIKEIEFMNLEKSLSKLNISIDQTNQRIEHLRKEIIKHSTENKILISSNKKETFLHWEGQKTEEIVKIIQEENSMMFDLEQKIIGLNQLYKEKDIIISEMETRKDYLILISSVDYENVKEYPNRIEIIGLSTFLILFFSSIFFVKYEK